MLKLPQNLKFKKYCKKFNFVNKRVFDRRVSNIFLYSSCGLVAKEGGNLTAEHFKTCLKILNKVVKLKKSTIQRVFSSLYLRAPLTKKSVGSRMGRGKGTVNIWVFPVKPGRVLFQIQNVKHIKKSYLALKKIQPKLPMLTHIILRKPQCRAYFQKQIKIIR